MKVEIHLGERYGGVILYGTPTAEELREGMKELIDTVDRVTAEDWEVVGGPCVASSQYHSTVVTQPVRKREYVPL